MGDKHYEANCKWNEQLSQNREGKRIECIIKASKIWKDTLDKLVHLLEIDPELKVKYHLSCADKYCSTKVVLLKTSQLGKGILIWWKEIWCKGAMSLLWLKMWSEMWFKALQRPLFLIVKNFFISVKFSKKETKFMKYLEWESEA